MAVKVRRPKSEGRTKAEIRNPNSWQLRMLMADIELRRGPAHKCFGSEHDPPRAMDTTAGARAVPGSQRVRLQRQCRTDLTVLSEMWPLRAGDGSRSGGGDILARWRQCHNTPSPPSNGTQRVWITHPIAR